MGTASLLFMLSLVAIGGLYLTFMFREETMGKSLEEMSRVEAYEATENPSDLPHLKK